MSNCSVEGLFIIVIAYTTLRRSKHRHPVCPLSFISRVELLYEPCVPCVNILKLCCYSRMMRVCSGLNICSYLAEIVPPVKGIKSGAERLARLEEDRLSDKSNLDK